MRPNLPGISIALLMAGMILFSIIFLRWSGKKAKAVRLSVAKEAKLLSMNERKK
jgi:hypothetical protein